MSIIKKKKKRGDVSKEELKDFDLNFKKRFAESCVTLDEYKGAADSEELRTGMGMDDCGDTPAALAGEMVAPMDVTELQTVVV